MRVVVVTLFSMTGVAGFIYGCARVLASRLVARDTATIHRLKGELKEKEHEIEEGEQERRHLLDIIDAYTVMTDQVLAVASQPLASLSLERNGTRVIDTVTLYRPKLSIAPPK